MRKLTIISCFLMFLLNESFSQEDIIDLTIKTTAPNVPSNGKKKKLNFFIVSKRKKGKLDLATRFNVLRSKIKSTLRFRKFVAIVADNAEMMSSKVRYRLEKFDASIGTIWFDSHGIYRKGYSLFQIGHSEISYKTLADSSLIRSFAELAPYATDETKLVIGSCYGGATYKRSSIDYKDTTFMNGDSLMFALGKIISHGSVFGSEAWVMTKPGLFKKKPAVGGCPGRKLFRDSCYAPVWSNVGVWNQYDVLSGSFNKINPIALDMNGNLVVRGKPFVVEKKFRKEIEKNLSRLEKDLYK